MSVMIKPVAAGTLAASISVTCLMVAARPFGAIDAPWINDLALWLHAAGLILALSATTLSDQQVRVDVFYQRWSGRRQVVNLAGVILLLLPALALLLFVSVPYAWRSILIVESSAEEGGMPGLFLVKACLPLGLCLLAWAAWLRYGRLDRGAAKNGPNH